MSEVIKNLIETQDNPLNPEGSRVTKEQVAQAWAQAWLNYWYYAFTQESQEARKAELAEIRSYLESNTSLLTAFNAILTSKKIDF